MKWAVARNAAECVCVRTCCLVSVLAHSLFAHRGGAGVAARSGRRSHHPPVWQADVLTKQMVVADFEHELLRYALGTRGGGLVVVVVGNLSLPLISPP